MSNIRKRNKDSTKPKPEKIVRNQKSDSKSCGAFIECVLPCVCTLVLILAVTAAYGYYRAPFQARSTSDYSVEVQLKGVLEPNRKLADHTKIPDLLGPESIVEDRNKNLYTGLIGGRIVRIAPSNDGVIGAGEVTNLTNGFIPNIARSIKEFDYGRPLGMRLVKDTLYVADANYGLYMVDIKSGEITTLLTSDSIRPGLGFTNDLSITKNGEVIYFSDASSKYSIVHLAHYMFEGLCDGRILQYNIRTKEVKTVLSGLCFSNGVQLSKDEKQLYVCETFKYRVLIADTNSWEIKNKVNMPMTVDNIRPTGRETYWVAGSVPWTPLYGLLEKYAFVRQILAGLLSEETLFRVFLPLNGFVVEMTKEGIILLSFQDPKGEGPLVPSEVAPLSDDRLAVGSFSDNFLTILDKRHTARGVY